MGYRQIIIVGCGLAGVLCALRLHAKTRGEPCHIILLQSPCVNYDSGPKQGGGVDADYSDRLKQRLAHTDIECIEMPVLSISRQQQLLVLQNGISVRYDYLVLPDYGAASLAADDDHITLFIRAAMRAKAMEKFLRACLRRDATLPALREPRARCVTMSADASQQLAQDRRKRVGDKCLLSLLAHGYVRLQRWYMKGFVVPRYLSGQLKPFGRRQSSRENSRLYCLQKSCRF